MRRHENWILERAERVLRDAYGFADIAIGDALEGGYANDLFRVVADGTALVLRIKHPPAIAADIAWEHRLVAVLADRLAEIPAPLVGLDGRTFVTVDDRVAWLLPFVAGSAADPAREQQRLAAARALGRVHRAGADIAPPPRPRLRPLARLDWPPAVVPAELADWGEAIRRARDWATAYVASLAAERDLRLGVVHGDFFPGNVLIAGREVVAVIDWEEAQVDWLTWDLANAVGTFCAVDDDLDRHACDRFVAAYRAAGGTAPAADDDLLVPLVRVKRVLEVLRAPTDRHPRWAHQRQNLRSLAKLAD